MMNRRQFFHAAAANSSCRLVRQRFRDQILHDVMHGPIPRAIEEA